MKNHKSKRLAELYSRNVPRAFRREMNGNFKFLSDSIINNRKLISELRIQVGRLETEQRSHFPLNEQLACIEADLDKCSSEADRLAGVAADCGPGNHDYTDRVCKRCGLLVTPADIRI